MALLLADERPDLIGFDGLARQVDEVFVQEALAVLASVHQDSCVSRAALSFSSFSV